MAKTPTPSSEQRAERLGALEFAGRTPAEIEKLVPNARTYERYLTGGARAGTEPRRHRCLDLALDALFHRGDDPSADAVVDLAQRIERYIETGR